MEPERPSGFQSMRRALLRLCGFCVLTYAIVFAAVLLLAPANRRTELFLLIDLPLFLGTVAVMVIGIAAILVRYLRGS